MSEAFKWNLSPTERRIAEATFAAGTATHGEPKRAFVQAGLAVSALRGDASYVYDLTGGAMLAELRSEPVPICSQRVVSTSFVSARGERYRELLIRALDSAIDDAWLADVREELAR